MFKEFESFKQAAENIDSRANSLRSQLETKRKEHEQAVKQYRQMMVDDSAGTRSYTTAELNKAKMQADELASEVQVAEERLQMVSGSTPEKLQELLDEVYKGWERETAVLRDEITNIFQEARELRAKLTLKVLEAHQYYKKSFELRNIVNDARRLAGIKESFENLGVPEYIPTGLDRGIEPMEDELRDAYLLGKLLPAIQHYAETGEVLMGHEEWRQVAAARANQQNEQGQKGLIDRIFSR